MAKAAKGRKTPATRTPRKKRGAKLLIDQPQESVGGYPRSQDDEALRERCLQFATGLNGGKEMKLADLIKQASEIYEFIKHPATTFSNFGIVFPTPEVTLEPKRDPSASVQEGETSGASFTNESRPAHRSKFEETHAL